MARTANVFTRVEPTIKAQAEVVLEQLGISMSTAMEMYLRQIALQRKIPFEMKLPEIAKPITCGELSDEQFDLLMEQAARSYAEDDCAELADFKQRISKEYGL